MLRTHDRPKKRRNRNRLEATGNGSKLRFTAMLHFQAFLYLIADSFIDFWKVMNFSKVLDNKRHIKETKILVIQIKL